MATRTLTVGKVLTAMLLVALAAMPLLAGKGGNGNGGGGNGGGGGGDPLPPGVIFCSSAMTGPFQILPDGSMPLPTAGDNASFQEHEGERWFLHWRRFQIGVTPEGRPIYLEEVFAVNNDGDEVVIASVDNLTGFVNSNAKWAKNDSFVTFPGDVDPDNDVHLLLKQEIQWGIDGPSLVGNPVPVSNGYTPGGDYDLSADGTQIVYEIDNPAPVQITKLLVVENLLTHNATLLGEGTKPRWSPTREEIVYVGPGNNGFDIHIVAGDGSGTTVVASSRQKLDMYYADWAPDGNHLAIQQRIRPKVIGAGTSTWPLARLDLSTGQMVTILESTSFGSWR